MAASKEAVRRIVRQCEAGEGAAIPEEDYDIDGGLDNSKIFCAICRTNQSTDVSTHYIACFAWANLLSKSIHTYVVSCSLLRPQEVGFCQIFLSG